MRQLFDMIISIWYFWVLVALGLIYRLLLPKVKGIVGEKAVTNKLKSLPEKEYCLLNDIMLATEQGTTQIDHVLVSIYGVFVIETKNYKGWIMGGERDEYWVQHIYKTKNRLYNPIRQNYAHIKALSTVLSSEPNVKLIPIVAFSNDCDLKIKLNSAKVIYFSQLKKCIFDYSESLMDYDTMQRICKLIKQNNIVDKAQRRTHVKSLQEKKKQAGAVSHEASGCPRCGAVLIRREGKNGPFFGCSRYPKCRYTTNVKQG